MESNENGRLPERKPVKITRIGGQAVMEGVMMRGKSLYALSVRKPDGEIATVKKPVKEQNNQSIWRLPVLRGMSNFISSMVIGVKCVYESAELSGLEDGKDEKPSKLDMWLEKRFGDKLVSYIMSFSVVIAVALSVFIFILLPLWLTSLLSPLLPDGPWALGVIEGFVRFGIFVLYLWLISRAKEMKKTFRYHGAEHKTIHCYEHNEELTVENVKRHTRLHKRCGTSFLLIVMVVSMVFFLFVRTETVWLRFVLRIVFIPFIAGFSYEIIRWAGRSESPLVNIISYPGMCLQKLTTAEPDDQQIQVAIEAMKAVLAEEGDE